MIIELSDDEVSPASATDDTASRTTTHVDVSAAFDALPVSLPPLPVTVQGGHTGGTPPLSPSTGVLPATMPPAGLTQDAKPTLEDAHAAMIRRVDARIRDRASRVLANSLLADSIDDGSPIPPGWTERMYRTALDARKCEKEAPMYLKLAQKTLDSFKRVESIRPTVAPQLHADVKVYVRGDLSIANTYKVVDVADE